jgi:hypothetical protein
MEGIYDSSKMWEVFRFIHKNLLIKRQIGGMRFDEGLEQQLHGERRQLGAEKNGLMNEIDQFEARF